jgi:hypothetical protein
MLEYKKEIEVKKGLRVTIDTKVSEVEVRVKEIANAVIEYQCNSRKSEIKPEDILSVTYDEEKNELRIEEKKIKDNVMLIKSRLRIDLPFIDELSARSENGLLDVNNIEGRIRLENENGKIILAESNGSAEIVNENGMVKLNGFNGKQSVKTENGIIEIENCDGILKAYSENGQIRVLSSRQVRADIETENGSIFYQLPALDRGNYSFKSENGKIHLVVPSELAFDLEAVNENGSFHIGLPDNYETKLNKKERTVRMVRGNGKTNISVRNENGSIDIVDETPGKINEKKQWNGKDKIRKKILMSIFDEPLDPEIPESLERLKHKVRDKMKDIGLAFSDFPEEMLENINKMFTSKEQRDYNQKREETVSDSEKEEESEAEERENPETDELLQRVLQMVENGTITAEEAEKLINTIDEEV